MQTPQASINFAATAIGCLLLLSFAAPESRAQHRHQQDDPTWHLDTEDKSQVVVFPLVTRFEQAADTVISMVYDARAAESRIVLAPGFPPGWATSVHARRITSGPGRTTVRHIGNEFFDAQYAVPPPADPAGHLLVPGVRAQQGHTLFVWDAAGYPLVQRAPDGAPIATVFDGSTGQLRTAIVCSDQTYVYNFEYSSTGSLARVSGSDGASWTFTRPIGSKLEARFPSGVVAGWLQINSTASGSIEWEFGQLPAWSDHVRSGNGAALLELLNVPEDWVQQEIRRIRKADHGQRADGDEDYKHGELSAVPQVDGDAENDTAGGGGAQTPVAFAACAPPFVSCGFTPLPTSTFTSCEMPPDKCWQWTESGWFGSTTYAGQLKGQQRWEVASSGGCTPTTVANVSASLESHQQIHLVMSIGVKDATQLATNVTNTQTQSCTVSATKTCCDQEVDGKHVQSCRLSIWRQYYLPQFRYWKQISGGGQTQWQLVGGKMPKYDTCITTLSSCCDDCCYQ